MNTEIVIYTTNDGWKEFRKVPRNLHPADHYKGTLVGPPDLTSILSKKDALALNNALVDAGIIDYKSLVGHRANLLRLVQSTLGIRNESAALNLRLQIIGLYQRDYYLVNEV